MVVPLWTADNTNQARFLYNIPACLVHFIVDTCIIHPNISDEFDNWHFRQIQNGRRRPFCQKKSKKKSCVSIWNGKNCDRKLFSDIQNGRRFDLTLVGSLQTKRVSFTISLPAWSSLAKNSVHKGAIKLHHHPLKCVQWVVLWGGALGRMFGGSPQFLFVFYRPERRENVRS